MYLSTILLSLTTLALSTPTIHDAHLAARQEIPYGAYGTPAYTPSPRPTPYRVGHAIVQNHCPFPVYIWSVSSTVQPMRTINPNDVYNERFHADTDTGGIAIKISTESDGLYTSAPQMIFAYNLSYDRVGDRSQEKVWYDLNDVFGDPFEGYPVSLTPSEPAISWEDGVQPAGSQIRVVDSSTDLVLSLC
ncbi:uncharacterized protein N7515_005742 [Penicillium bovifimosum]|uniref:Blastomyces yeast-phase-specific protein n=1 Tax=Penicillium bovifimosum TaxID=126998 RepID=A0A9W9GTM5_9EURO|nr:uncharacterized protein N7515_005742 [Penicillium bovifimosum]KAJ5129703.1 hypothetical protein N7515_005742 [Penicillium bovifimosum]